MSSSQPRVFADIFLQAMAAYPARTALEDPRGSLTYSQLDDAVAGLVQALRAAGLGRGSPIALLAPNSNQAVCVIIACYVLGARFTPLHPMGSLTDHAYILNDAGITCLIVDGSAFPGRAQQLAERAPGLSRVYSLAAPATLDDLPADERKEAASAASHVLYAQAEPDAKPDAGPDAEPDANPDNCAILIYTGGTTGTPKGIMHTHRSMLASVANLASECEWPEDLRFLAVTPISHAAHLMIPLTLMRGGTFIMIPAFSPQAFVDSVRQYAATATFMVPTMIYALLDHAGIRGLELASLRTILYSAAAISPTRLAEALEVFGPVFVQSFGQTEAPMTISVLRKADHSLARPQLLSSCGRATGMSEVSLLDDQGEPVPEGEVGEICVRGALVMQGYWRLPEQTGQALAGGWLHTGDLARQDPQGYLYIVDRKKDMIVSGGFNVFPREIEDILAELPAVATAAVIGVPDPHWGEAVCALIVCRPGQIVSGAEVMQYVKQRKGPVYAPKQVEFLDSLPLTALGKPDKKVLRDIYWKGAERRV